MLSDKIWRVLFSMAIAVLMAGLLLIREETTPIWVLVCYPLVGAALANIASRTNPSPQNVARVETSVIAAAAIFVLACLVNLLLIEMLVGKIREDRQTPVSEAQRWAMVILPLISVCLWWALERRLTRFRNKRAEAAQQKTARPDGHKTRSGPPVLIATSDPPRQQTSTDKQPRRHIH